MKCRYCNGTIPLNSLSIESGLYYDDSCIKQKYAKRSDELESKISSGKIRLDEMNEYKEIQQILENMRADKPSPSSTEHKKLCKTNGFKPHEFKTSNNLITRPNAREQSFKSFKDAEFKKLEEMREKRWIEEKKHELIGDGK